MVISLVLLCHKKLCSVALLSFVYFFYLFCSSRFPARKCCKRGFKGKINVKSIKILFTENCHLTKFAIHFPREIRTHGFIQLLSLPCSKRAVMEWEIEKQRTERGSMLLSRIWIELLSCLRSVSYLQAVIALFKTKFCFIFGHKVHLLFSFIELVKFSLVNVIWSVYVKFNCEVMVLLKNA